MGSLLSFFGRLPGGLASLHVEDPLDRSGQSQEPFLRGPSQSRPVVETVEHVLHDLVLLQHHGDGLGLVDTGVLPVLARVLAEGRFQVLGDADVVDDESGGLVAEDPVDPGDRLHESVSAHRLVDVHCVHARGIETGQPHVPDDHQFEGVVGVLDPLGEQLAGGPCRRCAVASPSGPRLRRSSPP